MTTPIPLPSDPPAPRGLDDALREAEAISKATGLLPATYAGNPGAVLLVKDWAERNGIAPLEAFQGVSVYEGKIWIGAGLRTRLATMAGWEFRPIEISAERCELEVWDTRSSEPTQRGRVVVTIDEIPESKFTTSKGRPTPWAQHPADMLFATACRRGDKYYIQTAGAVLDATAEFDLEDEPARTATTAEDILASPEPSDEIIDAEIVDEETPSLAALRARLEELGIKEAAALKAVRESHPDVRSIDDLEGHADARTTLADWIDQR